MAGLRSPQAAPLRAPFRATRYCRSRPARRRDPAATRATVARAAHASTAAAIRFNTRPRRAP